MLTIKDILDSYIKRFDSKREAVEELSMQMDIDEKTIEYWTTGKTGMPSRKNTDALRQVLNDAGLTEEANALSELEKREPYKPSAHWDNSPSQPVQNHRQAFPVSILNETDIKRYEEYFPERYMFEFMLLTAAYGGDSALAAHDLHKTADPLHLCKDFNALRDFLGMNEKTPDSIYGFWKPVFPSLDHIPEDPYDIPNDALFYVVESVINSYRDPAELTSYEKGLYRKLTVNDIYAMICSIEELEEEADKEGYLTIAEYTITTDEEERRIVRLTSNARERTQKLIMLYLYARHPRYRNSCSGRLSPSALECFTKLFDIREEDIIDDSPRSLASEKLQKLPFLPKDSTKTERTVKVRLKEEGHDFVKWYESIDASDAVLGSPRPFFSCDDAKALPFGKDFYSIRDVKQARDALREIQTRIKKLTRRILLIGTVTIGMVILSNVLTGLNPGLPQPFCLAFDAVIRITAVISVLVIIMLFIKLLFSDRASNGMSKKYAEHRMDSLYLDLSLGLI